MSKVEKAKVTLLTALSLSVGPHRFKKDVPVLVEGEDLISALECDGSFCVERLAKVGMPEVAVPALKELKVKGKPEAPLPSKKPSFQPKKGDSDEEKVDSLQGASADKR